MYPSTYRTRSIRRRHEHPKKYNFHLTSSIRSARGPSRVWSQVRLGPKIVVMAMETRTPIQSAWRSSRSLRSLPLLTGYSRGEQHMHLEPALHLTTTSMSSLLTHPQPNRLTSKFQSQLPLQNQRTAAGLHVVCTSYLIRIAISPTCAFRDCDYRRRMVSLWWFCTRS
jgi:hypothetical protein